TDFKNNAGRKTLPHTGKNCAEPLPGRIAPGLRPFFSGILPIVFHQIESLSRTIRHGYRSSRLRHAKMWLGAESNRRHVDFQSTALPTELPSRDRRRFCVAVGFPLSNNLVVGQPRRLSELPYKNFVTADAPDRNISQARVWHSLCRLDLQLESAT